MTRITVDEWLSELRRLEERKPSPEGLSAREIAQAMDCCERVALERLKGWVEAGLMEFAGMRSGVRLDGRGKLTPVYRLVKRGKVATKLAGRG